MTTAQRTAIASPATGLVVYDTTVGGMFVRTAAAWVQLGAGGGGGWSVTGNAATDTTLNFVGTTDAKALLFRVNGVPAGRIEDVNGNIAFGVNALRVGQATTDNIAIGRDALRSPTPPGLGNVAIGRNAMRLSTTGYINVAVGDASMNQNTTGTGNVGVGHATLAFNTTGGDNTALGYRALYSNTTGSGNVAVGQNAMRLNTTKGDNVAVGDSALYSNGTGSPTSSQAVENVSVGSKAMFGNTTGYQNTAVGSRALNTNATGGGNSAFGANALSVVTGNSNSGIGNSVLINVTSGSFNSGVGAFTGPGPGGGGFTGTSALGFGSSPTASNRINIGYSANNNLVGVYGAVQNLSDGRFKSDVAEDVPGLAFITKLRPVTYHLDAAKVDVFTGVQAKIETANDPAMRSWYADRQREVSTEKLTGFIAQEVEQAANEVGYDFDGVQRPKNEGDHYTLGYSTFVVPLVKAVQEQQEQLVSQQRIIAAQQQAIEHLENRMKALENR